MPLIKCSFEPTEQPLHTPVKVSELPPPDAVRVNFELMKRMALVSEVDLNKFAGSVEVQEMLSETIRRNSFESLMAQKVHLKPGASSKNFQQWMARMFPSFLSDKSTVKQVRNFLGDAKSRGENLWETMPFYGGNVNEVLAKIGSAEVIDDAYGQFKLILKNNNIDLSQGDLGQLWAKAIEVSQHERIMRMTQAGANGKRILEHRLQKFYDMAESFGISAEGAKLLQEPVSRISQAYDELWVFANNAGVDVAALQDMGYMNRIFSSDARFRMGRQQADIYGGFLESNVKGLGAAFQKSRTTYDFVVEDELLMAAALGLVPGDKSAKQLRNTLRTKEATLNRIIKARDVDLPEALGRRVELQAKLVESDNSLKFIKDALRDAQPNEVSSLTNNMKSIQRMRDDLASESTKLNSRIKSWEKQIGTVKDSEQAVFDAQAQLQSISDEATDKLNGVLTNERVLIQELNNLPDTTLDALVDSGVLSKLPMMTDDLYKFMVKKYKMPYKGLDELMVTDPRLAYNVATDQLKNLMGKSAMSQAMFANAIETGWGISSATKATDPEQYATFVKLSPEVYKRFGVNNIPGADDIYLHPMVANMYTGILEVSTDPSQLSTLAAVWQYTNRMFKKQALATTGFVGRQVYQLFISSAMSGTNLAQIIPAMADYIKFKRVGFAALDNTKKVYGGGQFTERELMAELVKRGALGHASAPIAGEIPKKANEMFGALDPRNAARALGYWGNIIQGRGVAPVIKNGSLQWDAVQYGAELAERMTDEASGYLMSIGVQLEQAAKLAHYRSVMRDGGLNAVGQFITAARRVNFSDIDEAIKHAGDYFFDYGDVGLGDKFMSKNVLPFWTYMSRNAPAVVRHVFRNPSQYMAYQRINSLMNQDVREAGEEAPVGGFQEFQRGLGNIYMQHPSGDPNKFVHVPFTAFDPVADALNTFQEGAEGLGQMFGLFPGAFDKDLKQVSPKNESIPFIDGLVESGYGSIKSLYAVISKKDPRTGKSLINDETKTTSFGGFEIPGRHAPLIKYLIENTLPSVANLNRLNPFGAFGIKEQRDGFDKVTRPAQRSWAGADRSDSDVSVDEFKSNPMAMALRFSGVTVNSVDTVKGMGFTESSLQAAVTDMKSYTKKLEKEVKELQPDDPRRNKLNDTIITTKALAAEIELGRLDAATWLTERGAITQTQRRKREKDLEKMKLFIETFK